MTTSSCLCHVMDYRRSESKGPNPHALRREDPFFETALRRRLVSLTPLCMHFHEKQGKTKIHDLDSRVRIDIENGQIDFGTVYIKAQLKSHS